eukprot:CAMPEP_0118880534 /NCGR_PEP_ID=MMETSP1163-20130328/20073_1 /TAXON_ID=124430 /ORGANISM="Phaeomonas parva, Strain CCMP2877" /LENGTH=88 /DNA_ID=CAMNT_0006816975 /DNA_START=201 /DNA_END=464 /DNA_ORIENTATION=-
MAGKRARRGSSLNRGEWIWLEDDDDAWVPGLVTARGSGRVSAAKWGDGHTVTVDEDKCDSSGVMMNAAMDNLVDLDVLGEGSILHHIR